MKFINKVCAHPSLLTWFIGSAILNVLVIATLPNNAVRVEDIYNLLLIIIPTTLLGYIFGMFTFWPLVRKFCSKYNGAPFHVGDNVIIITGPDRGTI